MIRGWVILSSLVLSVLFKLFQLHGQQVFNGDQDWNPATFPFSDMILNRESHVYYQTEHVIAIIIACCMLAAVQIRDSTPDSLIKLFILILVLDFVHYLLFFRDPGVGFNLIKVVIFATALLWTRSKPSKNT